MYMYIYIMWKLKLLAIVAKIDCEPYTRTVEN